MADDWRRSRVRRMWSLARLVRAMGIAAISGAATGLVVGGLGSRLAMRIAAIQTGPACARLITENGNQCGDITVEGTGFLLALGTLGFGSALGLAFLSVRPALDHLGRWRSLGFGLLLLGTFGFSIIDGDNPDFHRFGSAGLNVAMFAAIIVGFGLLVAPIYDRLERSVPRLPPDRTIRFPTIAAYVAVGLSTLLSIFLLPLAVGFIGPIGTVLYVLMLLVAVVRILIKRSQIYERWGAEAAVSPMGQRLQLAILTLPFVVGTFLTVRSITRIL